jgi:serine protease Do
MALERRFPDNQGVLVTGIRPGYPFETAKPNLQEGDVILSLGGKPVSGLDAFRKLAAAPASTLAVKFRRSDAEFLTVVRPSPPPPPEEGGELPKAWLGIKTQVVTPDVGLAMSLSNSKGFRITRVYPWTEASKAGLREGDVITSLNGDVLDASRPQDEEDLRRAIEDLDVGSKAELGVLREHQPLKLSVTLEPEPKSPSEARKAQQKEFEFTVREITPLDRMERRWDRNQKGVIVLDTTAGGWASVSGLEDDDVILAIDTEPVDDVAGFEKVMSRALHIKPRVVSIFVRRGYRTQFIFVEPDWNRLGDAP